MSNERRFPSLSVRWHAKVLLLSLAAALGACAPPARTTAPVALTFASPATPDLTSPAAAVVRVRVQDGAVSLTRSGVIVDPRGYVLTSFSAIGVANSRARGARPGTLFAGGDEVGIDVFEGPLSTAPTEYVGRVVRGDLRLNLALVRITGTVEGPLEPDARFPSADPRAEVPLQWGSFGWTLGAYGSMPSLVATHANVISTITNSEGGLSGYVVSTSDSNLEGTGYFDAQGRFTGIFMQGFVRPVSRIPTAWLDELAGGAIDDRIVAGVTPLTEGQWADVGLVGDAPYVIASEERSSEVIEEYVFAVPSARAGTITVQPPVGVVAYQRGRVLTSGTGEIFVPAETDVYVVVRMPRPNNPQGLRLRVRFASES